VAVYLLILVFKVFVFKFNKLHSESSVYKQVFLREFQLTQFSFLLWSSQQPYEIYVCAAIDLVHDQVEHALLSEVENLRTCQDHLKNIHERSVEQVSGKLL